MAKTETPPPHSNRLYRSDKNKMIAGVCAGLADYFHIDPTIVRIIFVILALFHGSGVLIYIILWILVPAESSANIISESVMKDNLEEMKERARTFAHSIGSPRSPDGKTHHDDSRMWWAILIILVGFYFLFRNFGIFDELDLGKFWPVILIILGLSFFLRR